MSKKYSQSRSWIITLKEEGWTDDALCEALSSYTWAGQVEEGSEKDEDGTGYRHYQIYIENQNPVKFTTLQRKLPTAHLEVRRGSKADALAYVQKEETRVRPLPGNGVIEIEEADQKMKRTNLDRLREMLESGVSYTELLRNEPSAAHYKNYLKELESVIMEERFSTELREVHVEFWWGKSGSGKTRKVWEEFGADAYRVSTYLHPFDNYRYQPVLVLEEFRSQLDISMMLNLLDIYPMVLPCRYQHKYAGYTTVIIISNYSLEELYPELSRDSETWQAFERRIHKVVEF